MGKQTRRRTTQPSPEASAQTWAPTVLADGAPRYFASEFVPIRLSQPLRGHPAVQVMLLGLKEGALTSWQLGRRGTCISSKFVTACGTEDTLRALVPNPSDDNFGALVDCHVCRLKQVLGLAPDPFPRRPAMGDAE